MVRGVATPLFLNNKNIKNNERRKLHPNPEKYRVIL
jgi:hypothetical protein